MADSPQTHYLTFQRGYPIGEKEDDGVYVEVNDQGYSGYNVISMCEVTRPHMTLILSKPLGSCGQIEGIEVEFTENNLPPAEFLADLRSIFTGQESRLRIAEDVKFESD